MAFFGTAGFGFVLTFRDLASRDMNKAWGTLREGSFAMNTVQGRAAAMSRGFRVAGGIVAGAGAVIGAGLGLAVKSAIDYNTQLARVGAISKLSESATKKLGFEFDKLTARLPLSSFELAEVAEVAARLGITFGKTEDQAIEAVKAIAFQSAILAKAVKITEVEAATAIGRLSAVFGLDIVESAQSMAAAITDAANTTSAAAPFITDVAIRAGPAAKQVGITAAQVVKLSGSMAAFAPQARGAAAGLNAVFRAMLGRSEDVAKFLGLTTMQFQQMVEASPEEALLKIVETFSVLGKFEREAILKDLGLNAVLAAKGVNALVELNSRLINGQSKLRLILEGANQTWEEGRAAIRNYERISAETSQQLLVFFGNVRNLAKGIGEELLPIVNQIVAGLVEFSARLVELSPTTKRLIAFLALGTSAFLLVGGAVLLAIPAIAAMSISMGLMGISMLGVVAIAGGVVGAFAAIAGVVAGLAALWTTNFGSFRDIMRETFAPLGAAFRELFDAFSELGRSLGFLTEDLFGPSEGMLDLQTVARLVFSFMGTAIRIFVVEPLRVAIRIVTFFVKAVQAAAFAVRAAVDLMSAPWKALNAVIQFAWDLVGGTPMRVAFDTLRSKIAETLTSLGFLGEAFGAVLGIEVAGVQQLPEAPGVEQIARRRGRAEARRMAGPTPEPFRRRERQGVPVQNDINVQVITRQPNLETQLNRRNVSERDLTMAPALTPG